MAKADSKMSDVIVMEVQLRSGVPADRLVEEAMASIHLCISYDEFRALGRRNGLPRGTLEAKGRAILTDRAGNSQEYRCIVTSGFEPGGWSLDRYAPGGRERPREAAIAPGWPEARRWAMV